MANIKRLTELRDKVLPFIPAGRLNMSQYFHTCGTPSCVAGHAALHPPFEAEGYARIYILGGEACMNRSEDDFFGVTLEEWKHIFSSRLPNDPVLIAQHITDVIEANT